MTVDCPEILYEDNHIIVVNKRVSDISQKDKTNDISLDDIVRDYIKAKYDKPGAVFLGIAHRLDRPTSGAIIFARTSKALTRLNKMFKEKEVKKTYWAVVKDRPPKEEDILTHYLLRKAEKNKSYCHDKEVNDSKIAVLHYKIIASSDRYFLLEIDLMTGRHHQIRSQLSKIGSPIKGDLKYGFPRSNKDGGIHLHARKLSFIHPIKNEPVNLIAPVPDEPLWKAFEGKLK